jgi:hypothetical protein
LLRRKIKQCKLALLQINVTTREELKVGYDADPDQDPHQNEKSDLDWHQNDAGL